MTIQVVVDAINSKMNTISGWETGRRAVKLDDLARLAKAYRVSPSDLLKAPEDYEKQLLFADLSRITSRLTADQLAHMIRFVDAISSPPSEGTKPPGVPSAKSSGTSQPSRRSAQGETPPEAAPEKLNKNVLRVLPRVTAAFPHDGPVAFGVVTLYAKRGRGKN